MRKGESRQRVSRPTRERDGRAQESLGLGETFWSEMDRVLLPLLLLFLLLLRIVPGKGRSVRTEGRRLTSEHVHDYIKKIPVIAVTGNAH